MKISVLGTGYVGLVTAACFAELGNEVFACDVDAAKIAMLAKGEVPFYEPGLAEIVTRNAAEGRLTFSTDPEAAVRFGEVIFIAVGTPPGAKNGEADLSYVRAAALSIGASLERNRTVVVMKSTAPVGTSGEVERIIRDALAARGSALEFAVVSNPEFLKEGSAVNDFMRPDRIVVGVKEPWAKEVMAELYATFAKGGNALYFMDPASSEMTKYAANAALAARISLMNELATIAEAVGADIEEVRKGIAADQRIGKQFLYPGIGYGGSCFPKDVQALAAMARTHHVEAPFVVAIESVNQAQRERFVQKILAAAGGVKGKRIALWGLAFKPQTDDMRQAPSVHVVERLLAEGASVIAYDPIAAATAAKVFGDRIAYAPDMYACLEGATLLVVVTEWPQFKEPDFARISSLLSDKLIVDGRNIYDPLRMQELGFRYVGIGRGGTTS